MMNEPISRRNIVRLTGGLAAVTVGAGFWTGTGRIGMQLPIGASADGFRGQTIP